MIRREGGDPQFHPTHPTNQGGGGYYPQQLPPSHPPTHRGSGGYYHPQQLPPSYPPPYPHQHLPPPPAPRTLVLPKELFSLSTSNLNSRDQLIALGKQIRNLTCLPDNDEQDDLHFARGKKVVEETIQVMKDTLESVVNESILASFVTHAGRFGVTLDPIIRSSRSDSKAVSQWFQCCDNIKEWASNSSQPSPYAFLQHCYLAFLLSVYVPITKRFSAQNINIIANAGLVHLNSVCSAECSLEHTSNRQKHSIFQKITTLLNSAKRTFCNSSLDVVIRVCFGNDIANLLGVGTSMKFAAPSNPNTGPLGLAFQARETSTTTLVYVDLPSASSAVTGLGNWAGGQPSTKGAFKALRKDQKLSVCQNVVEFLKRCSWPYQEQEVAPPLLQNPLLHPPPALAPTNQNVLPVEDDELLITDEEIGHIVYLMSSDSDSGSAITSSLTSSPENKESIMGAGVAVKESIMGAGVAVVVAGCGSESSLASKRRTKQILQQKQLDHKTCVNKKKKEEEDEEQHLQTSKKRASDGDDGTITREDENDLEQRKKTKSKGGVLANEKEEGEDNSRKEAIVLANEKEKGEDNSRKEAIVLASASLQRDPTLAKVLSALAASNKEDPPTEVTRLTSIRLSKRSLFLEKGNCEAVFCMECIIKMNRLLNISSNKRVGTGSGRIRKMSAKVQETSSSVTTAGNSSNIEDFQCSCGCGLIRNFNKEATIDSYNNYPKEWRKNNNVPKKTTCCHQLLVGL